MIRAIEEMSMNAWPALQTMLYDGWVLRFANGYTRRSNSINPIYPSCIDLQEKIAVCESIYRSRGLPVTYKVTDDPALRELDALLEKQGYSADAHTSVQLLDMSKFDAQTTADAILTDTVNETWLAAFCQMSKIEEKNRSNLVGVLGAIVPACCFGMIKVGEAVVACGMGVLQDGYIGLYDIVTDSRFRRQGHGRQIVKSLLAWGKRQGAHTAYLQVMKNNPAALALYAGVGYEEKYGYWYRIKR